MPTQRMLVRVPVQRRQTTTCADLLLRCGSAAPSVAGRAGTAVRPKQGEESTIFLEGKNFSIHDTHVLAGGKPAAVACWLAAICSR